MAYGSFKVSPRRTSSNNKSRNAPDKEINIAKNPKYDGYQGVLAWMIYKSFAKKISISGVKSEIMQKPNISWRNT